MNRCVKLAKPEKTANIDKMHTLNQHRGFKMIGIRSKDGVWHPLVFTQALGGGHYRKGFIYFGKGEQHKCFKYPTNPKRCESVYRVLFHMYHYAEKELDSCEPLGGFQRVMPKYKYLEHYKHATLPGNEYKTIKRWVTSNIMYRAGKKVKPCAGCEQSWRDQRKEKDV